MADVVPGRPVKQTDEVTRLLDTPDEYLVSWKSMKLLIKHVLKNVPKQGENIVLKFHDDGVQISAQVAIEADFPLKVSVANSLVQVSFGTFCGRVPKIYDDVTGALVYLSAEVAPVLSITGEGAEYIAIKSNWELSFTHGFMSSGTLPVDGVEIIVSSTDPTILTAADGEFYVILATLFDGVITGQAYTASIAGWVKDHGERDSKADLVVG